jgi:thioredoxin-related protein
MKDMKSTVTLIALVCAAVSLGAEPKWNTDYAAAVKQARAQKKVLLLDFTGSDWCAPCIRLKRTIFSSPEFKDWAAKNAVLVELDFPRAKKLPASLVKQNESLAEKYNVQGFPTVLMINPSGKILWETGYDPSVKALDFVKMAAARAKS